MTNHKSQIGFSLVELLVVITIIVLLLALLAPALDKAIYEAELVQCAAQQRMIAGSSSLYAMSHKRRYPTNAVRRQGYTMPTHIGTGILRAEEDLRPIVRDYIPIRSWIDPLAEMVDLSMEASNPETVAVSSFNYWAGWEYGDLGRGGMIKMGDKLGWYDDGPRALGQPPHVDQISLLASDQNGVHHNSQYVESAHPDDAGITYNFALQNGSVAEFSYTWSMWFADGTANGNTPRGAVDNNVAYDDGSVLRYAKVTGDVMQPPLTASDGTVFHAAPWHGNPAVPAWRFVPLR